MLEVPLIKKELYLIMKKIVAIYQSFVVPLKKCKNKTNEEMDKRVKYWIELSEYDLETAKAMLRSERYLYVGFMCHQTIEKAFKAYFTKIKSETAPFSHSLSYLAKKVAFMSYLPKIRGILLTRLSR